MEGAVNHIKLLLPGEFDEVDCIAADPDGELGVQLRVIHSVYQSFPVHYVYVHMVPVLPGIAVQQGYQVVLLVLLIFAQCIRDNGEGIGNAVLCVGVGNLGHGQHGGNAAVGIPAVHGICTGGKGLPRLSAVRGGAGFLAVNHVGGNGEDGHGGDGIPVGSPAGQALHKAIHHHGGQLVHSRIIVAELGVIPLNGKVRGDALFVPDGSYLGILDGGQAVHHHGKPGKAAGGGADDILVVEGHLQPLVAVFVVHEVDDVQGVDIELGEPFAHILKPAVHIVKLEGTIRHLSHALAELVSVPFVPAVVDGIQQRLCQICSSPEELHLLADGHCRNAAGDAVIVPEALPHQLVVFILNGGGADGDPGTEFLEILRQLVTPQHREIRLRRRPQIHQSMQEPVAHLGDHVSAVLAHAADGFRHPGGIPGEQLIVGRGPQEAHHPQLHDEVIHQLLDLLLGKGAVFQILLGVDVQEGGNPP